MDVSAPGGTQNGGRVAGVIAALPGQETDPKFQGCAVTAGLGCKSGTSMAAPVVSGLIGLSMLYPPIRKLPTSEIRRRLMATARADALYSQATPYYQKPKGATRRLPLLGSGLIDAQAFLVGREQGIIVQENARVKPGLSCSTLGRRSQPGFVLWILVLPLLGVWLQSKTFHKLATDRGAVMHPAKFVGKLFRTKRH